MIVSQGRVVVVILLPSQIAAAITMITMEIAAQKLQAIPIQNPLIIILVVLLMYSLQGRLARSSQKSAAAMIATVLLLMIVLQGRTLLLPRLAVLVIAAQTIRRIVLIQNHLLIKMMVARPTPPPRPTHRNQIITKTMITKQRRAVLVVQREATTIKAVEIAFSGETHFSMMMTTSSK
jgi:hypothetical protein